MEKSTASPARYDTLLLCGSGKSSHAVGAEKSKAFLTINGTPLFIHVLTTLDTLPALHRIFIIGDKERLDKALQAQGQTFEKEIIVLPQWRDLMNNIWHGFLATLDEYTPGDEVRNEKLKEKVIFVLPGDIPLVGKREIEEFIAGSDMNRYDHVIGFTPLTALLPYGDTATLPGISMTGYHVAEGVLRLSNLHISRPFAFENRIAIQQIYESRYQNELGSAIALARYIFSYRKVRNRFHLHLLTHVALTLHNIGLEKLSRWVRRRVRLSVILEGVDDICSIRTGYKITKQGGAALDIDNENDYQTMRHRFVEWKRRQE